MRLLEKFARGDAGYKKIALALTAEIGELGDLLKKDPEAGMEALLGYLMKIYKDSQVEENDAQQDIPADRC